MFRVETFTVLKLKFPSFNHSGKLYTSINKVHLFTLMNFIVELSRHSFLSFLKLMFVYHVNFIQT